MHGIYIAAILTTGIAVAIFEASFLALNFGRTRYGRCPHCQHWHWTT